jgi:hypothetical protein
MGGHASRLALPSETGECLRSSAPDGPPCSLRLAVGPAAQMVLGGQREDRRGATAHRSSVSRCLRDYQQGFSKEQPCTRRGADPLNPVYRLGQRSRAADCRGLRQDAVVAHGSEPSTFVQESRPASEASANLRADPHCADRPAPFLGETRLLSDFPRPVERFSSACGRTRSIADHASEAIAVRREGPAAHPSLDELTNQNSPDPSVC